MRKTAYIFLLSFFTVIFFKSQSKTDASFLINTWKLKKLDKLTAIYQNQQTFDKKWGGIRFKKNGKFISLHPKRACVTAIIEQLEQNRLKLDRQRGTWKMDSDTTIIISSSSDGIDKGKYIVYKLPDNSLSLKRFIRLHKE
ncbi:hypothetical protein CLU96_1174 [Chryseobacterium sp. 52]|uniref:hypothetical protein n=1 Tax=Chryseobacterium sp. 52 TaxID=2035213 RepID=UPI000C188C9B|nr:hypothetical protein [Chryseobacterium sp. 52]PIF44234.1 hypothetical protein CLU96_1174 [Chryseobacterium sp. 52]